MINKDQKKIIKHVLVLFGIITILGLSIYFLNSCESRLAVWDGEGANALASNPVNWDTDTAPVVDDDILFDGLNVSGDDPCTWDLSTNSFGNFNISTGYSGAITISASLYCTNFDKYSGSLAGTAYIIPSIDIDFHGSGNYYSTTRIRFATDNATFNLFGTILYQLDVQANVSGISGTLQGINVAAGKTLTVSNSFLIKTWDVWAGLNNAGTINLGANTLHIQFYSNSRSVSLGDIIGNFNIYSHSGQTADLVLTLSSDVQLTGNITSASTSASKKITLDLNGHDLITSSITVGNRVILQCGEGNIYLNDLNSYNGTIIEETGTWIFSNNGTINAIENEQFYNLYVDLPITIVNGINVTNELRLYNIEVAYSDGIDVYCDSTYIYNIIPVDCNYSYGAKITTTGYYSYLPTIIIHLSNWYQDTNGTWYAYISCNLPVTYNITGEISAFAVYNSGKIIITPPSVGNYSFIITGTHSSGSLGLVSGYTVIGMVTDVSDYDMNSFVWGLLLWIIITFFMIFGLIRDIPLVMICTWCLSLGNIVLSLTIDNFGPFVAIFALVNTVIFAVGMIRWRI